ncbi:MAG: hypothetical protein QG670_99 [Thermoproteota archaeon]|nr:hypothetical protein [Thermoproteota archaeon]
MIIAGTCDPYKTDDQDHLDYQELNRRRGRMSGQLRIKIRYRKYATPWLDYLLASKDEVKEIIKGTGWRAREFIDSEGSSYILVMEKEECNLAKTIIHIPIKNKKGNLF